MPDNGDPKKQVVFSSHPVHVRPAVTAFAGIVITLFLFFFSRETETLYSWGLLAAGFVITGLLTVYTRRADKTYAAYISLKKETEVRKKAESVHIARDISKVKEAQRKMEEAVELKTEFVSMISHELRTPLTAIREGVSIVIEGRAGELNGEQKEFLNIAKRNVDRLARLINEVLDLQKFGAGKMEFDIRDNDINGLAEEIYGDVHSILEEKGLGLEARLGSDIPLVKFDRDKIHQVISNLISNAVKFTEEGGITLSTVLKDGFVEVSVSDTGHGIYERDMDRLFHAFEQIQKGNERKTGGTGLGLVISKNIIEKHNGRIWAESKPGKGSVFYFTLPVG